VEMRYVFFSFNIVLYYSMTYTHLYFYLCRAWLLIIGLQVHCIVLQACFDRYRCREGHMLSLLIIHVTESNGDSSILYPLRKGKVTILIDP
jgi:hypothetical protein